MDPLTQGSLGAALPQSVAKGGEQTLAMVCGFLAGMAPDLDVLIRSSSDPLLFLEYHRQFTHSLVFIPVGAALVSLALWAIIGRRRAWAPTRIYFYCLLGYGTHALLDACTTYGTQLLWPFTDRRFAWNNVSIIDPLVTIPLVVGIVFGRWRQTPWPPRAAFVWVLCYLCLGLLARDWAREEGYALARSRGHTPLHLEAKPSFANIILWKIVYREEDRYYVDAVRLGPRPRIYSGASVAALDLSRDLPWLDPTSVQARDVERFRWFSMGFLAMDPHQPGRIMDLRYSLLPNEIRPLWGIELNPAAQQEHVRYTTLRSTDRDTLASLVAMLRGRDIPLTTRQPSSSPAPP